MHDTHSFQNISIDKNVLENDDENRIFTCLIVSWCCVCIWYLGAVSVIVSVKNLNYLHVFVSLWTGNDFRLSIKLYVYIILLAMVWLIMILLVFLASKRKLWLCNVFEILVYENNAVFTNFEFKISVDTRRKGNIVFIGCWRHHMSIWWFID